MKSARGLAHSKSFALRACVLECGCPLPLFDFATSDGKLETFRYGCVMKRPQPVRCCKGANYFTNSSIFLNSGVPAFPSSSKSTISVDTITAPASCIRVRPS